LTYIEEEMLKSLSGILLRSIKVMKAKIFFPTSMFFLSFNLLIGQVEFPILNAHWCYDGYTELSFDPWTYCISPSELVELNGKTYSKITYFPHPNDSQEQEILYRGVCNPLRFYRRNTDL